MISTRMDKSLMVRLAQVRKVAAVLWLKRQITEIFSI